MPIPLELYLLPEENTDFALLQRQIDSIDLSCDKVRKAMFARHGELAKMYIDLLQRMEILERNICNKIQ